MKIIRLVVSLGVLFFISFSTHAQSGKSDLRKARKEVKKAGRETGHAMKKVGKSAGRSFKDAGKAAARASRKASREAKKKVK